MKTISVAGSPLERGRAYGEEARGLIADVVARWCDALAQETSSEPGEYIAHLLAHTDFPTAIAKWTPDLGEEVRGIAEGSGQSLDTMTAFQLLDEQWFFEARRRRTAAAEAHHCSGIAVLRDHAAPLLAQNMDIPVPYNGSQVVLRVEDERTGRTTTVFTAAGLIALTGMNDAGVGVCVNTLMQLRSAPEGLPVAFAIRGLLASSSTAAEAAAFVRGVDHASGQNFLIAGPDGVVDLEACAGGVAEVVAEGRVLAHTNHPLANDARDPMLLDSEVAEASFSDSAQRLEFVAAAGRALAANSTPADVQRILADRSVPICRVPEPGRPSNTLGSVVMECDGSSPVIHVAPGYPDRTPFEPIPC